MPQAHICTAAFLLANQLHLQPACLSNCRHQRHWHHCCIVTCATCVPCAIAEQLRARTDFRGELDVDQLLAAARAEYDSTGREPYPLNWRAAMDAAVAPNAEDCTPEAVLKYCSDTGLDNTLILPEAQVELIDFDHVRLAAAINWLFVSHCVKILTSTQYSVPALSTSCTV
jgi:hypothetical protein